MGILNEIPSKLIRTIKSSHSIPSITQLDVPLQFLATGTFQTVVASAHGILQTSLLQCVKA